MGERSAGRDTAHHTKGHRVGHRTQCQGQNRPGRMKRNLLTRPRKKRGSLGSGELSTWGGKRASRGPLPRPAAGWVLSTPQQATPDWRLAEGLERGPQSGGRRLRADGQGELLICHLLVVGPWRTDVNALCLISFSVKWGQHTEAHLMDLLEHHMSYWVGCMQSSA